jgi:hypothetical protein
MERLSMQWRPCGAPLDAIRKPLAVLFPWVWAGDAYVVKYVALLHSFGFDVLLVSWSYAAMWVPIWARHMAWRVIEAVGKDLQQAGERPVVFYAFSGAAKVRIEEECCSTYPSATYCATGAMSACRELLHCLQKRLLWQHFDAWHQQSAAQHDKSSSLQSASPQHQQAVLVVAQFQLVILSCTQSLLLAIPVCCIPVTLQTFLQVPVLYCLSVSSLSCRGCSAASCHCWLGSTRCHSSRLALLLLCCAAASAACMTAALLTSQVKR